MVGILVLLLISTVVLALLKAIPMILAGKIADAKDPNYFKAFILFAIIYGVVSVYIAITGSLYLQNIVFILFDVGGCVIVASLLLKPYGIVGSKNKILFFTAGILLNILLMLAIALLISQGTVSVLPTP